MKAGKYDGKPEGGKLLRVRVELEGSVLAKVRVNGDFFAHPEQDFEDAESRLAGIPADRAVDAARESFAAPGLTLYGADAENIAIAIGKAIDDAQAT